MPAKRDAYHSPAIRAFANELTAHREQAGLNIRELADLLGYTRQYVSQIEACKNRPSRKYAEDCDSFFKTNGVFLRLWKNIDETQDLMALPPGFTDYVEREALADELRIYCALLVVGLFQCDSYARTIIRAYATGDGTDLLDKRMARKQIFDREDSPQLFLILDEGVLQRVIGGPSVMCDQLRYLLEVSRRPKIQIQVIRYNSGYHQGLGGDLIVLHFDDGPGMGYVESGGIGVTVDQPEQVASMTVRYDVIRGHALSVDESRVMIHDYLESYERQAADQMAQEQP
jgi:transcriptional regulator with XRE-family HTH domain